MALHSHPIPSSPSGILSLRDSVSTSDDSECAPILFLPWELTEYVLILAAKEESKAIDRLAYPPILYRAGLVTRHWRALAKQLLHRRLVFTHVNQLKLFLRSARDVFTTLDLEMSFMRAGGEEWSADMANVVWRCQGVRSLVLRNLKNIPGELMKMYSLQNVERLTLGCHFDGTARFPSTIELPLKHLSIEWAMGNITGEGIVKRLVRFAIRDSSEPILTSLDLSSLPFADSRSTGNMLSYLFNISPVLQSLKLCPVSSKSLQSEEKLWPRLREFLGGMTNLRSLVITYAEEDSAPHWMEEFTYRILSSVASSLRHLELRFQRSEATMGFVGVLLEYIQYPILAELETLVLESKFNMDVLYTMGGHELVTILRKRGVAVSGRGVGRSFSEEERMRWVAKRRGAIEYRTPTRGR